jgi:hypothetical protein
MADDQDPFFKVRGRVARELRPPKDGFGALYEIEFEAQKAKHRSGEERDLGGCTLHGSLTKKLYEGCTEVHAGDDVIALFDPRTPQRPVRIIHVVRVTFGPRARART